MTIYGRSEELVSRCVECDLAEPESLASLGGSAPGLVDGILSQLGDNLCHLGGCIPDPNPVAVVGVTIPMPLLYLGPSQKQECQWHATLSGSTTQSGVTSQE